MEAVRGTLKSRGPPAQSPCLPTCCRPDGDLDARFRPSTLGREKKEGWPGWRAHPGPGLVPRGRWPSAAEKGRSTVNERMVLTPAPRPTSGTGATRWCSGTPPGPPLARRRPAWPRKTRGTPRLPPLPPWRCWRIHVVFRCSPAPSSVPTTGRGRAPPAIRRDGPPDRWPCERHASLPSRWTFFFSSKASGWEIASKVPHRERKPLITLDIAHGDLPIPRSP